MSVRKAIVIPDVQVGTTESIKVIALPGDLTEQERLVTLACMISTLRGDMGGFLETTELYANIMVLAFPGIRSQMVNMEAVRIDTVNPTSADIKGWVGLSEDAPAEGLLAPLPGPVHPAAQGIDSVSAVYAAIASLLFAVGRQASESATAAALNKRPDALIRRFQLDDTECVLLPGREAGPSRKTLEQIYNALGVYTEIRWAVVSFFLGAQRAMSHPPLHLAIVLTNFQLMRGAGMTHVDAILKLVQMRPWVLKVPMLEPYWRKFANDMGQFNEVEKDVRPYHRLLVSQSDYLFLSSDLLPLIAVAGHYVKQVEKTYANYVYKPDEFSQVIEEVTKYEPGYVPGHKTASLAALLGVEDVPLPPKKENLGAQPEEDAVN